MKGRGHRTVSLAEAFLLPVATLVGLLLVGALNTALAGGPNLPGSAALGADGGAILWDSSTPVAYRVDGGSLGSIAAANTTARVNALFQVWEAVPTASIQYTNAGPILSTGSFTDGDVSTASEFNNVANDCDAGNQTPIMLDADGALVSALGLPSGVIGFAGPCKLQNGRILSALALLNGRFIDGNQGNGELTSQEFDEAFIHEFGHLSGLDHSQINVEVLNGAPNACAADDLAGLPIMFPFAFCQARQLANPALSTDDAAWISKLYPEPSFTSSYGHITGTVFFSDGLTPAQGVNVIARAVDNPATAGLNEARRVAVSAVSGYLFTGNPGQSVTGTNTGGSSFGTRNVALLGTFDIPVPPGTYRVEVESIHAAFAGGSGVGPLSPPIPSPGPKEFWDSGESATDLPATFTNITVAAGQTQANINIILNGTPPRFDAFESASLRTPASFDAAHAVEVRPRRRFAPDMVWEALPA